MHIFQSILPYAENLSYLGVFIYFALLSYIIWIPEEIVLLAIGYMASVNGLEPWPALSAAIAGALMGDNLLFYLSRHGSPRLRRFEHKLSSGRVSKYRKLLEDHIGKTIIFSRFIAGLRFVGPYMAGTHKVSWKKFFVMNALAGIIVGVVFLLVGYHYEYQISRIITEIGYVRHIIFTVAVGLIGYFLSAHLATVAIREEEREMKRASREK